MLDLKSFIEENGIEQSELVSILGVKQPYVSMLKNGIKKLNERHITAMYNHYGNILDKYILPDIIIKVEKPIEDKTNTRPYNSNDDLEMSAEEYKTLVRMLLKENKELREKLELAITELETLKK